MLKTHDELHDRDTTVNCKMRFNYSFYPNNITDYIVIQQTFKDNVENKALIFIILVQKFKN